MDNLRDNNYGYTLPAAVIRLIEEFEEEEDKERLECLDKILDSCDSTDVKLLRNYENLSGIIEGYFRMLDNPEELLNKLIEDAKIRRF